MIAQGYQGRTTLSCDDGQTWIADRSFDKEGNSMVCGDTTPVRCGITSCHKKNADGSCSIQTPCDCGHDSGYAKGIAIAQDQILANFGWGEPGMILSSLDGVSWSNSHAFDASYLYPNLVFANGRFVHFSSQPEVSDDGIHWRNAGFANFNGPGQPWNSPRAFNFLDYSGGGRLIGVLDDDVMRISNNGGDSWYAPASIPAGCGDGIGNSQRVLTGNNVAVLITSTGKACRSADGGNTWTLSNIGNSNLFPFGVFAQGKFMVWSVPSGSSNGIRYSSIDGAVWTATPMKTNTWLGAVGASTAGTLVSTNGIDTGYKDQVFLRSTDGGLTWSELPTSRFTQSHAIHRFGAGMIKANGICAAGQ